MADPTNPPATGWIWVSTIGSGGDDPGSGYWVPPADPNSNANYVAGGQAASWTLPQAPGASYFQPGTGYPWVTPGLQRSMNEFFSTPTSGYGAFMAPGGADYGAQLGRWQFSNTAPIPPTAPKGWGRYPTSTLPPITIVQPANGGGSATIGAAPPPMQLGTNYTLPPTTVVPPTNGGVGGVTPPSTQPPGVVGGYGPVTPPLSPGVIVKLEDMKPAGATPSGVGSSQYPVFSDVSQYKPPAGAVNDPTYGVATPAVTTIGGKKFEVNVPEGAGYETYLRTIIAAAGGGPGIANHGTTNKAYLFGGGSVPTWTPGLLGTVTPVK